MTKKSKVSTRKKPKQDRSIFMVDSILTAATRVFNKFEYKLSSTNRIAEIAGVSIGSLYQYFSGKESIVKSLIQKRIDEQLKDLEIYLDNSEMEPLNQVIRSLIERIAKPALESKNISKLFYEQGQNLGLSKQVLSYRVKAAELISTAFLNRKDVIKKNAAKSRILILINAVLGAIATEVLGERVSSYDELISELTEIVLNSLIY